MSPIRLHKWVFAVLTRLYPGRYFSRQLPAIRPKRRPVSLDIDQFDRRESPTSFFAVDPVTASLVSFASLHEPLPPVIQTAISTGLAATRSGASFNDAAIVSLDAITPLVAPKSARPWWWYGDDGATSSTTASSPFSTRFGDSSPGQRAVSEAGPATFLSTISGADIAGNLEALPSAQTPFVDPLADFIPLKNKPILSSGGESGARSEPGALATGADSGGSLGGSGSSAAGANASQGGFSDSLPSSSPFGSSLALPPGALSAKTTPAANAPGLQNAPVFLSPLLPVSPSPALPPGTPPPRHKKQDPLWVLDANKAIVVNPGTTENEFSNTAMDLRMQVSGATVSTYSWDLTNAPDTTSVSGSSTYDLTFIWKSFTGAAKTETIVAKETPSGGSQVTQTLTFLVAGTDSPAWSTPPTTYSTWSNMPVLTPDMLTVMQGVQCCHSYGFLGLTAGDLQFGHGLPSYNPGVPALGLQYDSIAANTLPIFMTHFQIDPSQAVPPTVKAQLTFNSVVGSWIYYDTSHLNPGDIMQIPLQGDATGLSTGRYSWSISVTANYSTPVTTTYSGNVDIVNSSSSPFGAGWSLNVLERIWPVTGSGVILELPSGLSLWFANGQQSGTFVTPAGDTSTLVLANNVYTRTLKDGTKVNFNSNGYQTSIVDTNNNSLAFGWNGSNQLTSLTDFNSLVTTLAYSAAGKVTSITDPANRISTMAYDTGNTKLTAVTDPDSAAWGFGYDSANRLTTLTDPRSKVTTYAYGTGRVTTVTRADNSTLLLTALELQGIPASGTGTSGNPATSVLAAQATAAFTDARNNIWNTRMDWLGFGEPSQQADPLGDLSNTYRDTNGFPWLIANPLGQRTRNFFDTLENVTEAVNADDTHHQATFNSFSEPLIQTDELSNVATMAYDTHGNLTTVTDSLSHITTMAYTSHGFLSTTTDPLSHTTTLAYDSRSRETSTTDPLSHTGTMAYDSASNMTGSTDMNGNHTTYTFDSEGRLLTTLLPGNTNPTTNSYDAAGNLTAVTDPLGHTKSYGFDNLNRQTSVTDPLSHTMSYGLDGAGNQTTVTDPLSHTTTFAFDSANRLTAVTDANSHTTSYGLDAAGERTTMTDALSHVTSYQYDNRDRQTATLDPLNDETKNTYDGDSNKTTVTQTHTSGGFFVSNGETTTFAYDTVNRKTSTTDPNTNFTSYGYDSANRQTTTTDPLGHVSTTLYDADNRVTAVTDALGHTTSYGYDNNGNRTTVTDPLNRVTTYGYDQQNRLTTVTDPLTGVTTYAYDQASRKTSITDADNNTTTNAYDNANRLTTVTDPNNHLTTYAYDNANRLTSTTDRNNRQTTYSYDSANNKIGETWVGGSYIATYSFDAANRLTLEQDNFSKYTLTYDNSNRLTNVDNNGTPSAPHVLLTYGYDNFNNRTSIADNFSSTTENLTYDGDNNLTNVNISNNTFSNSNSATLAYDSANRLTTITRKWGNKNAGYTQVQTTYGYDNADRLTGITDKTVGGSTLMTLTYGYDQANQLTSYAGPDGSITYGYDNDGQLTGATGAHNETYTYDKEGNRTMTGYVTSIGNRLTSDGTYSYTYDQDGNMLTQTRISDSQLTSYTWDFRNRLTEVLIKTSGGTTVQDDKFTYDIENRRIGKNTLSGGQSWTAYVDQNPFMDFNTSGSLLYRYMYGNAIDFLIGRIDTSGNAMWYLTDKLGSVRENIDGSGNVLDSITYDTFGNIIAETHPTSGDRFKYTSREWDSEIGQYFYRARYYSPTDGRFESEDPLGFRAGDTDLYRYTVNKPTESKDSTGLDVWVEKSGTHERLCVTYYPGSNATTCFSFAFHPLSMGIKSNCAILGITYIDESHDGIIFKDFYLKTSHREDVNIFDILLREVATNYAYIPGWYDCGFWSELRFRQIQEGLGNRPISSPPNRPTIDKPMFLKQTGGGYFF